MYYIKDIRTEKELAHGVCEDWAKELINYKGFRLMTTTRDDHGSTTFWVTTK